MPSLRAILLLVLFWSVAPRANAGEASDYLLDLWTSDDDLPDTSVTAITQTPDGYLWVGTDNGLARFDGVRFTTFDPANTPALKHAGISHLYTDPRGTLWITTHDGSVTSCRAGVFASEYTLPGAEAVGFFSTSNRVYFATLDNGIATRIEPANPGGTNAWQKLLFDGRRPAARNFCQDAAGVLWCLLNNGSLRRVSGTNIVPLAGGLGLDGEKVGCLTADPAGQIWVGTGRKILRWNGAQFENQTPTNGEPEVAVSFLFCTASNGWWAIASNSVRHAVNRRWTARTDAWSGLVHADPFYIRGYEARNDAVWFRQYGHGLFCAAPDGRFFSLTTTNGLPDNRVSCWFQDREDNVWVGMDHGGLLRLRPREFQMIGGDTLKNIPATTVCEDPHGNLWFGTFDHGLNRWHDGQLTAFKLSEGVNPNAFFSACPDAQGRLWLSADHEDLFVLETNRLQRLAPGIHGIKCLLADSQNRLWLGRQNQLTCISAGQTTNCWPRGSLDRSDVRALAEDPPGTIWYGMGNGALGRFSGGILSTFKPDGAAEAQAIWSLLPAGDGAVWAGTFRGGLLRFKAGKFTRYTTAEGLPSDVISQILDDGLGNLWFGSHKGIFYVRKAAFAAFDQGEIASLPCVVYGLHDGLPSLECFGSYQPSACRSHDGRLWFATVKGLVVVDPRHVQRNQLPPPVVLENFLVDGKNLDLQPAVQVPPGRHQFEFRYTALSFTAPEKVRFRCRLQGFDNDWINAGTSRRAAYGPLPPGDYQFQITACNNDGVWNETGASLRLTQLPFFWQTWWFELLAFVAGGLAMAGIVGYAATRRLQRKLALLKQQRAIERERERIARDIHDDLGAGLTQIMLQSSLARRASSEQMHTDLSQISETARDLVRAMDEIVWAINPENDTLDGLVTYVGKYVQDYLTAAKLRCRLDLPAELPAIMVAAEIRHHVFLAVKEALNNVVKHASATELLFQLQLRHRAFVFVIKDDGVGLDGPAADALNGRRISSGHGLRNLPRRLERIGGTCVIHSEPGHGTQIELSIPISPPPIANAFRP